MAVLVVVDADFLSAFLKIGQLDLLRRFYQVDQIHITQEVYREIAQTTLLAQLTQVSFLNFVSPDSDQFYSLQENEAFRRLGVGEQASIAWAIGQNNAILLTNDNRARQVAAVRDCSLIGIANC